MLIGENPQGQTSAAQAGTAGPGSSGQCLVGCLGKTKRELQTFGTSRLRPEAAAHRVHNASRKPKDQVRLNICYWLIGLLTILDLFLSYVEDYVVLHIVTNIAGHRGALESLP